MEKMSALQKKVVNEILANLEKGAGVWEQGWISDLPKSCITGKRYRGLNRFWLSYIAAKRCYNDSRWMTYHQMVSNGWNFKKDADGNCVAKGQGVTIEYFEFRDRKTKKAFDESVLDGMEDNEKREYHRKNVYIVRKGYIVFNASLVEGVPEIEIPVRTDEDIERVENLIDKWSDTESKIEYGGSEAAYIPAFDKIILPDKKMFTSGLAFYGTVLHEMAHSTGHASRLNRPEVATGTDLKGYAMEELRAEISSLFLQQELGIDLTNKLQNSSAYIASWKSELEDNPNALFEAINDADKITKYIMERC